MTSTLFAALALASGAGGAPTKIAEATVARVSMFKNGYAFVTRTIPATGDTAEIVEVPRASLGTLWFLTDDGSAIESVESATDIERTVEQTAATNLADLVRANVGKRVSVLVQFSPTISERLIGTIASVSGAIVTLVSDSGEKESFNLSAILDVRSSDLVTTVASPSERERRFYRIRKAKAGGNVVMLSLERGLTWVPAYALDLTDPKRLTLVARATLMNDVYNLKDVPTRLITGFPNLPYASILDPISSGMTIDQWLGMISGNAGGGGMSSPMASRSMMAQNAYEPLSDSAKLDFSGVPEAAGQGEGIGDLFFYDLSRITLPKGARQSCNLFRFESDYRHVYTWSLGAEYDINQMRPMPIPRVADEVWHTIEFTNTTAQPLTTGVATILQKGELTGQTTLSYIPAGAKAEARINKGLDITPDRLEEETARERGAIKDRNGNPTFDLITIRGTLKLTNRKRETVDVRITKDVVGEILTSSDGGKITKLAGGLGEVNGRGRSVWNLSISPAQEVTRTYTYRVYIRS